ncbi:CaiB/BaiF CoA transferase family protein [Bordetella genomosp. 13]|uniref:CoA transferase n=1 Tax=Bordetella genomosp. 13 TaxID=463040 RepID=A0A1W6Z6D8_9BORD|nr:CaiB/BaiF CoA-transferase family protein [Bordetella genomosp. 13]ARP92986.1 CoA transferase [Bordetella genomosp. 13]
MQPLSDITVLDFSTLLPGPLCTLLLAEAGARVIKIERPDGDEMRGYVPRLGEDSVNFTLLNRGKTSVAVDLKDSDERARVLRLVEEADVLVEQFRPGVMQRLGLDYDSVARINPRIVYCSITGYGQTGPKARVAAHDLNYQAETGMLALAGDAQGRPVVPPALTADIAGGAYPAMMNILLALRQREHSGSGCHLDISMADNLFTMMYWGLGNGWGHGEWPRPAGDMVTGGSSRYQVYETADGRYLAAAPLEEKFWRGFVDVIGLPQLADEPDGEAVRQQVAAAVRRRTADQWMAAFEGRDTCVSVVASLEEAVRDPHFQARGIFEHEVANRDGQALPALPVPIAACLRMPAHRGRVPGLGEHTRQALPRKETRS